MSKTLIYPKCPECGKKFEIEDDFTEVACPYCESIVYNTNKSEFIDIGSIEDTGDFSTSSFSNIEIGRRQAPIATTVKHKAGFFTVNTSPYVRMPKKLFDENYGIWHVDKTVSVLRNAGFVNIISVPEKPKRFGFIYRNNEVIRIHVNGMYACGGEKYPANSQIVVYYCEKKH